VFYACRIRAVNAMAQVVEVCGGPTKVAAALGVSAQAVCFWRDGKRRLPVEYIPVLEQLSAGVVRRWDLRPQDWWVIWPELVGAEGAPEPNPEVASDAA
jgi:DNA-binding transcriptional regulator YdaS (Cro superfamily)